MSSKIPKGWVTISEFEAMTGLKNRTIMSAINRGAIPADCVDRFGNTASENTPLLFDDIETVPVEPKTTTAPYYINSEAAALHWHNSLNLNRTSTKPLREGLENYIITFNPDFMNQNKDDPDEDESESSLSSKDYMSYQEALRKEKVAKAQIAELELKEKEGSLVSKSLVYNQLFSAGQEIRNALLTIPDRITDNIIAAAGDRPKILNLIYDAISSELEKLSDINNRLNS